MNARAMACSHVGQMAWVSRRIYGFAEPTTEIPRRADRPRIDPRGVEHDLQLAGCILPWFNETPHPQRSCTR